MGVQGNVNKVCLFSDPMNDLHKRIRALWDNNTSSFNRMLIACVKNEPNDLIKALKDPDADPTLKDNVLIEESVLVNHVDIVKILLEDGRADPSVHENFCLINGPHFDDPLTEDQQEIINLITKDHRVLAVSIKCNQKWHTKDDIIMIRSKYPELLI